MLGGVLRFSGLPISIDWIDIDWGQCSATGEAMVDPSPSRISIPTPLAIAIALDWLVVNA